MNWDQKFLSLALQIASWSKDKSTKVGAVIVGADKEIISTGYNGMCRGINDDVPERHERPTKYMWFEHGERNAIYNAARLGVSTKGATIYVTSTPAKFPCCADCARAIIQSGIVRVVQEPILDVPNRWSESTDASLQMFTEAGIILDTVSLDVG